ncbi:hypothetical protein FB451DRAFT_1097471 [Mycena latifolia]|nr:hypothetical protein FB451DRAFT_1097471 [Mycena latifolia]
MKEITPSNWDDWPSWEQLAELSGKANGLFHYAATALQWIEEQIRNHKKSCRTWVFGRLTQMGGLDPLEDLYRLILTSFEDIDRPAHAEWLRDNRLCGFRHVIGSILVLHEPLSIPQIIALLADIPEDDFDVANFLEHMRSVLIPGTTTSFEEATPQMHKSFRDYIMDEHAPAEFRILTGHAHFVTARSCLEVIVKAGSQSDVVVEYCVEHWCKHLRKAVEGGVTCENKRMWNLFEHMVEEAVFDVWKVKSRLVFIDVAAAGWGLLKQGTDKHRMEGISNIVMKAKVRGRPTLNGTSTLIGRNSSDLLLSFIIIQIVRPPVSLISTNFFFLQPYKSIWEHGLLQTWDSNQSLLPGVSSHSVSQDKISEV